MKKFVTVFITLVILASSSFSTVYAAVDICDEAYLRNIGVATLSCIQDNECTDGSGITALNGDDNIAKIFNYFLPKGYKDFQIAGMLGNMKHESGIEPQVVQGKPGQVTPVESLTPAQLSNPKLGYGLVQWTPVRKMIDPVRAAGKDPNDLGAQLDFLWDQLEGRTASPEKKAGDHLKATTDVASATVSFETKYERHAGAPQAFRITDAEKILNDARASGATNATASVDGVQTPNTTTEPASSTISKVYILGDSITVGANATYQSTFGAAGITPTVSAVTSRSWNGAGSPSLGSVGTQGSGKDAVNVDQAAIKEAGAIVVALGTNGGLGSNPVDEVLGTLKSINTAAPIYWVNIASSAGNVVPLVAPFNNKLKEQQSAGSMTMIDWAQVVNPGGDGTTDSAGLLADGIHPKPGSYPQLVDTVVRAVSSGVGSVGSSNCNNGTPTGGTGLAGKVVAYAWPDYHAKPYVDLKPEYATAIQLAKSEGRYVGGIKYPGVDCGGFVTTLMIDSGFEPNYNYDGRGGDTSIQKKWLDANWENLGAVTSTADLRPGDVAMQPSHTFVFVGEIPGFNSQMASASLDGRAPMADKYGLDGDGIVWYRKR